MIVAISGPASTGKTNTFDKLKEHSNLLKALVGCSEIEFKKEYIRSVMNQVYPNHSFDELKSDPDRAIELQLSVGNMVYLMYQKMIDNPSVLYICDRSPLDSTIYTLMDFSRSPKEVTDKYSEDVSKTCSLMRSLTACIDRIYLTSTDHVSLVEDDGFRPNIYTTERQLEVELFNSVFEYNPKVIKLPSDSNNRISTIISDFSTELRRSK